VKPIIISDFTYNNFGKRGCKPIIISDSKSFGFPKLVIITFIGKLS
jgi:hypothetical protein